MKGPVISSDKPGKFAMPAPGPASSPRRVPELLVSVRNLAEAQAAVAGGCDRLDVKEPLRGPLGRADADTIAQVARFAALSKNPANPIPCSVALGEICEMAEGDQPFLLPDGVSAIKLGPAGLESGPRWKEAWRRALRCIRWDESLPVGRVAVAYADWQAARSAPPEEILAAAAETGAGADAFLIDTWGKGAGGLFNALSHRDLTRLAGLVRRTGMTFALAGSLRLKDLDALVDLRPDVIAVRGAACEGDDRTAEVSAACVRRLKAAICELF